MHRLAIAKDMYIHGVGESAKPSSVSFILAILNFDYAAETLIKAVLLDKNVQLEKNNGDYKTFHTLIIELKPFYNKAAVLNEITALHKTRNDIQHNAITPSLQDVTRHKLNVRQFFDEICTSVYKNKITFESISLTYLVDSKIERIILDEMETSLSKEDYVQCIRYAKAAIEYHTRLLKMNMRMPSAWFSNKTDYRYITSGLQQQQRHHFYGGVQSLHPQAERYFDALNKSLEWIFDRMVYPQHYVEVEKLAGDPWNYHEIVNKDKAEESKVLAYNIITQTQWQLKEIHDMERPIIFDDTILNKNEKKILLLGIASSTEIIEAKLQFMHQNQRGKEINIQTKMGINEIPIDPQDCSGYDSVRLQVKNKQNQTDYSSASLI
jgi:hypothetical protein